MKGVCFVRNDYVMTFSTEDGNCYLLLKENAKFDFEHIELDKTVVINKDVNLIMSEEKFSRLFKISYK